jgi:hypothetical protein
MRRRRAGLIAALWILVPTLLVPAGLPAPSRSA